MAQILLLDGPTASGKSACLDRLRSHHAENTFVGRKFTTRKRRQTDNDWEFNFVSAIPEAARSLSFRSVANEYAVDETDLFAALGNDLLYCISCTDTEIADHLRQRYSVFMVYVYRPLSSDGLKRVLSSRNATSSPDDMARLLELQNQGIDFARRHANVDQVILNIGTLDELNQQLATAVARALRA